MPPSPIEPDTKDWTWVLDQTCPECGYAAFLTPVTSIAPAIRATVAGFREALARPDAAVRPSDLVWSPVEYSCHVRDVHRVFGQRVSLMLEQDDPVFTNWDQDETAVAERYAEQEPAPVGEQLAAEAEAVAAVYDAVPGRGVEAWQRPGRRSNGSVFTVASLGRYHLHDVVHHLNDVGTDPVAMTLAAYDASAAEYTAATAGLSSEMLAEIEAFAAAAPRGRVLEIGSGSGRDALALEERGLRVRRTDAAPGFVAHLRASGVAAERVDPLADDLADPEDPRRPYDGVWASASLLHVGRDDLGRVLARLAAVTRSGGPLHLSVKEGDGEGWSVHGHVAAPRHFTYWREGPLRDALTDAGWKVERVEHGTDSRGQGWWGVRAVAEQAGLPAAGDPA